MFNGCLYDYRSRMLCDQLLVLQEALFAYQLVITATETGYIYVIQNV